MEIDANGLQIEEGTLVITRGYPKRTDRLGTDTYSQFGTQNR